MRLRIIELLVVISVIGFACVSLQRSDPLFETLFFSFTLLVILAAILLAVGRTSGSRAFWIGFALSSGLYLALAHIPDADQMVPRHNGPELTTQLLRHAFNWLHHDRFDTSLSPRPTGGFFSVQDDPFGPDPESDPFSTTSDGDNSSSDSITPFPQNLSIVVGGGQVIVGDGRTTSFMRIGHASWALLFGWIGGHFARVVYDRSRGAVAGSRGRLANSSRCDA